MQEHKACGQVVTAYIEKAYGAIKQLIESSRLRPLEETLKILRVFAAIVSQAEVSAIPSAIPPLAEFTEMLE